MNRSESQKAAEKEPDDRRASSDIDLNQTVETAWERCKSDAAKDWFYLLLGEHFTDMRYYNFTNKEEEEDLWVHFNDFNCAFAYIYGDIKPLYKKVSRG
jgi:hypothetical protein